MRLSLLCVAFSLPVLAANPPRSEMLVSTDWLAGHLGDSGVVVLQVARERAAYDNGHIPGARFLPWSELVATRDGRQNELPPAPALRRLFERLGVSNSTRVILYSENLGLYAARAWMTLDYLGHGHRSALLDGGIEKWRAEKRPRSNEEPPAREGKFEPQLRTDIVVTLDQVRDLSWAATNLPSPGVLIVDTRPALDFDNARIPGAKHVYWQQHLASKENPVLRPVEELRRLYGPEQTVVTYCNTGVQASHSYFTLKYLGYDVRLYDGSFSEWRAAKPE